MRARAGTLFADHHVNGASECAFARASLSTHRCSCEQMHIRAVLCCAVVASGCSPARTRVRCGRACIHAEHRQRASDGAGDLIGINTAIYSPSGANSGVGFAIPVDTVKESVVEIIANGRVVRPVLGIAFAPDTSTSQLGVNGILVLSVKDGGPASKVRMPVPVTPQSSRSP